MFSGSPSKAGTYGPYVFKVTDTSNDTVNSASLSITVAAAALAVTTSLLPNGMVGSSYSATLAAGGGTPPYTWAVTSGGALPDGLTLSSAGAITGTPTSTGDFGPYVFTVTDSKSATAASASLSLTISGTAAQACPTEGNEVALSSTTPYAFLLKGTDGKGDPIYIAGSFTPNGAGGITAAEADYNGITDGPQQLQVNTTASSYSFNSSAQGCLYLVFSGLATTSPAIRKANATTGSRSAARPEIVAVPVANAQFSFNLGGLNNGVYNTGRIIEADYSTTKTSASGFMRVQIPTDFALTALQGNYAFGVDGWTSTAPNPNGVRTAMAGTFTNASGTLSAGYSDVNAGGTASGEVTGGYGVFNATIDAMGRGTGSYYLTTPTLTYDFVFYVVNGSDLILLSTDLPSANTPLLAGRALASSAANAIPPLSGYYLLASQGLQTLGINIGNIAEIGTLNASGSGITANLYSNYAGTFLSPNPTGSYTVDPTSGRTDISGLTSTDLIVYLTNGTADDGIVGFLVGTDPQASLGVVVSQTPSTPSYTPANVSGTYASSTEEDADGKNGAFLGLFNFSGSGAYTLTPSTTGTVPSIPTSGSILVNSDGSGNLDGGNFPFVTNGSVLFMIPKSGDPLLFVLSQ
jgi:hypothetical protein